MNELIKEIIYLTNKTVDEWEVFRKEYKFLCNKEINKLNFCFLKELTESLNEYKGRNVLNNNVEKFIFNIKVGSIVECWLLFLHSVYKSDYNKHPVIVKDKKINIEKLRFNQLCKEREGGLFDKSYAAVEDDQIHKWCNKIRNLRNNVHFSFKTIDDDLNVKNDIEKLHKFILHMYWRLPSTNERVSP